MKLNRYILFSFLLVLFFSSCAKDTEEDLSDTDAQLEEALKDVSNGLGKSFFTMPSSGELNRIPQDPNNPLTPEKVKLGRMLFHETALATVPKHTIGQGTYSCASCHHAQGGFQACLPQGIGDGGIGFGDTGLERTISPEYSADELDIQPLRSPSAMNVAYQKNMLWNGQFGATGINADTKDKWVEGTPLYNNYYGFEGPEIQAIAGLTVHRMKVNPDVLIAAMPEYKELFDAAFPDYPATTRISQITTGLAIAAYERTLLATQAPFQQWLRGDNDAMSEEAKEGAILFFGKANCGSCHTGPALNSMEFHALGMNDLDGSGVFEYDPNDVAHKGRGGFTGNDDEMYQFKVPQLYNLKDSPFYGHGSSFRDIRTVVDYKNKAIPENANVPMEYISSTFQPKGLTEEEVDLITVFLEDALYDGNLMRYTPEVLPSGNCFPNNDSQSQDDLGCN